MTCTRRVLLQTIGVGTIGCMMPACGENEGGVPAGKGVTCGNNLCLNLAENPDLQRVGGILFFTQAPGEKIFVMRVSESEFRALSAICTYQSCTVEWNSSERFDCPCHGCQYDATGVVTRGPATKNLRVLTPELAGDQLTVIIL